MEVTVVPPPAVLGVTGVPHRPRVTIGTQVGVVACAGPAISLTAFGLRCWLLGAPSLWYDEGVSWSLARQPPAAMFAQLAHADFNPPLYVALLHGWLGPVGDSEYALRYLSVIAGTLVVPLCWILARRLFQSWAAAALAAMLAATSVFLIDYSQEARGYALAAALGLLSAYALLRLLEAPTPTIVQRWWWGYVLATVAALYTHYAMLLLMPAHLLLVVQHRRRWAAVGAAWLGGAALYLPWLPSLGRQLATMRAVPDFWVGRIAPSLAPERVLAAVALAPGALPKQTSLVLVGGAVGVALLALAALLGPARSKAAALLPLQLVCFPLVEAALLTAIFPKFIDRYLLPIAPFAYVGCAALAALIPASPATHRRFSRFGLRATRRAFVVGAGLLTIASVVHAVLHAPQGSQEIKDGDTRTVAAFINANAIPGDAVLLAQDTGPVFSYYYGGALGGPGRGWFGVVPEFSRGDDLPTLAAALNAAAKGHSRLWVVLWHTDFADPTDYLRNALDVGATRLLTYMGADGYELRLYQLRPSTHFSSQASPLHPMSVRFGPHITFLGDGLEQAVLPSDVPFAVHTWFRTDTPLDRDYQVVLRLERDGHVWSQIALRPSLYSYPAQHWLPGIDVPGRLDFKVGADVPPADYELTLALYDPITQKDLSAVDATRGAIGTRVDLGTVKVLAPQRPGNLPPPARLLSLSVDQGLQLWGSGAIPAHLQQGGALELPLIWRATGKPQADYRAQVELAPLGTPAPAVTLTSTTPPAPTFGTRSWPAGDSFKDIRTVQLPPNAPVGPATLQLRVQRIDGAGKDRVFPLATVTVDPRPRDMTEPVDIGTPVGALFGDAALLAGVQIDSQAAQPGGQVIVTLFWQCRLPLDRDYTVFVHLLDANNAIGGRQHDGPPDNGTDPTSSWAPNQWITDRHVIPIPGTTPAGTYRLEVGLYRQNGEQFLRLPLAAGGDALIAGTVVVR
jgi:mannosyltransferase